MRIVFWQNCISPHQMPYISRLICDERVDEVVVVSDKVSYDNRIQMGWNADLKRWEDACEIIIEPKEEQIEAILSLRVEESWHLFSGIRAFEFVFNAFKKSLKYHLKRGLITERPNTFAFGRANGKPLWMHRLRFLLQDRSYAKNVDCVFAMGMEAVDYFKSVYSWQVFPFCYCTEKNDLPIKEVGKELPLRICYVGSLEWWKGLDILLSACRLLKSYYIDSFSVTLIGNGSEKEKLSEYCQKNGLNNISFAGSKPQTEVYEMLCNHDVLVLPSVYDGWGAVVNEALLAGLYTICSSACGSSDVIHNSRIGAVFKSMGVDELTLILRDCINRQSDIRTDKSYRKKWAGDHIGGDAIAQYMLDCLSGDKPLRPWVSSTL